MLNWPIELRDIDRRIPSGSMDDTKTASGLRRSFSYASVTGEKARKFHFPVNGQSREEAIAEDRLSAETERPIWLPAWPDASTAQHSHIALLDWTKTDFLTATIINLAAKSQGHLCISIDISFKP
ncbi:hypothetical protein QA648_13695 [Rhizobium sp. CB3171]|uniref:hypothetical protein n=1 Tax=Rhizobium sp. CB3171 TaxID=3039157 RepID=UPI0024B071C7|nr:hypothetical protein [Rhizobium sp. CB3171]WFU01192.1 hypothetical protein QA648_13695 [Rhizobium sp. CB3171]